MELEVGAVVASFLEVIAMRHVEVGNPEAADSGGRLATDDEGRDEEEDFVNEISVKERPMDPRSTLDQKSGDSAISQVVEKSDDIDHSAAVVGGKFHKFDAGSLETLAVGCRGFSGVDHDGRLGFRTDDERAALDSQLGVEDHPAPVISGIETEPARQPGVVGKDGVDTDKDCIVLLSQFETTIPRRFAGDPLGVAGARGDPTVERNRCFGADPWPAGLRPAQPSAVEDSTALGADSFGDLDAFGPEDVETSRSNWIRVIHGYHHSPDAGRDDRLDAGRSSTVMGARFQSDVEGAAAGTIRSLGERVHFGMGTAAVSVVPLTDETTIRVDHHGADHGVGRRAVTTSSGKIEGVLHPMAVSCIDRALSTGRGGRLWTDMRRLGVPR